MDEAASFPRGLVEELKDELATGDEPDSLEDLIKRAIGLKTRLCERQRKKTTKREIATTFPTTPQFHSRASPFRSPGPIAPAFKPAEPLQIGNTHLSP